MFQTKVAEESGTHILCPNTQFPEVYSLLIIQPKGTNVPELLQYAYTS
jgi:hypothetical protein